MAAHGDRPEEAGTAASPSRDPGAPGRRPAAADRQELGRAAVGRRRTGNATRKPACVPQQCKAAREEGCDISGDRFVIGVDLGTLSGRALVVRVSDGAEAGSATWEYPHSAASTSSRPVPSN